MHNNLILQISQNYIQEKYKCGNTIFNKDFNESENLILSYSTATERLLVYGGIWKKSPMLESIVVENAIMYDAHVESSEFERAVLLNDLNSWNDMVKRSIIQNESFSHKSIYKNCIILNKYSLGIYDTKNIILNIDCGNSGVLDFSNKIYNLSLNAYQVSQNSINTDVTIIDF